MPSWDVTRKALSVPHCKSGDNVVDYIALHFNVSEREEILLTSELNNLKHPFNY
jgi:hypothetical protein